MYNALRDKLKEQLRTDIDSEARAVYILVQARKILDTEANQRQADSLRLCCNWVVHASLERGTVQNFLALFDAEEKHSGIRMPPTEIIALVDFSRFRDEFIQLLRDHGIASDRLTGKLGWTKFISYFVRVIEDCPLTMKVAHGGLLDAVVVNAEEIDHPEGRMLAIKWTCKRRDGRPGTTHITQHRF